MLTMKNYRLIILASAVFVAAISPQAQADRNVEDGLKIGFVYNFIKFVDWPGGKSSDANEPIIVGVIGPENLAKAFEAIEKKKAKNRSLVVRRFVGFEKLKESDKENDAEWNQRIESLKTCHVLVFSDKHRVAIKNLEKIFDALKGSPILTVGDHAGFLEQGGIINLLKEKEKIRFEINLASSIRNKLKINASLLAMAKRVVREELAKGDEN